MIRSSGILLRFIVRLLGRETDYPKAEQLLGEQVKPIRTMEPHIRNGGQKPAHSAVAQLMEDWTHVLDEAEFAARHVKASEVGAAIESRTPRLILQTENIFRNVWAEILSERHRDTAGRIPPWV